MGLRVTAPFVFTATSTDQRQRHYRQRYVLGSTDVEIPYLHNLPEPTYSVGLPGGEWVNWYQTDDILLRPVRFCDAIADLDSIMKEKALVPFGWSGGEFFLDHPSAFIPLTRRPYRDAHYRIEEDIARHSVRENDRDARTETTRQVFARCRVVGNALLAPAHPPTWRVSRVNGRYSVDIGIERPGLLNALSSLHFGWSDLDIATKFADRMNGTKSIEEDASEDLSDGFECVGPTIASGDDGALATALSIAPRILSAFSRLGPGGLKPNQLIAYGRLRDLHLFGTKAEEASDTLVMLEEGDWPTTRSVNMPRLGLSLRTRRLLIEQGHPEIELHHFDPAP